LKNVSVLFFPVPMWETLF